MEEQIISFETAVLAKEKGFEKESFDYYSEKGELLYDNEFNSYGAFQGTKLGNYIDAPTQSLLQKWLREKYNIGVMLFFSANYKYGYYIHNMKSNYIHEDTKYRLYHKGDINTYEEALEKGLIEALKLIKL
jgi:hypothetical protein